MQFFVIGDEDTVLAFSLAGVKGVVTDSSKEAIKALKQALCQKEIGIILITEGLGRLIQKTIDGLLCKKRYHMILQIPDISNYLSGRRSVEDFVCSALGVKI
jgi:V/A-type H+-transporting ATPase subunit F